jgi:hypothetical protein
MDTSPRAAARAVVIACDAFGASERPGRSALVVLSGRAAPTIKVVRPSAPWILDALPGPQPHQTLTIEPRVCSRRSGVRWLPVTPMANINAGSLEEWNGACARE